MSSTAMMTKMPIEEETILLNMTKRMKLNSSYDECKETIKRPSYNINQNLSYVFPSMTQDEITNLLNKGFLAKGNNSGEHEATDSKRKRRKRTYASMTKDSSYSTSIPINSISNPDSSPATTNENDNDIPIQKDCIDMIIDQINKFSSKDQLRDFLLGPITRINNHINKEKNRLLLKEQSINQMNYQIHQCQEDQMRMTKTLETTMTAKNKESTTHISNSKREQFLSNELKQREGKINDLRTMIKQEVERADLYKSLLRNFEESN